MPLIKSIKGVSPSISEDCFVAENATVIGDVKIGSGSSLWYNTVIRGDVNKIRIGSKVNIQDGTVIHCTHKKSETHIGDEVSIGHNAIVHGCKVNDRALIGMGAIVMDNAIIESEVLVAAGSVVLEEMHLESGFIYAGTPAKKVKPLDEKTKNYFISRTADNYVKYASWQNEDFHNS